MQFATLKKRLMTLITRGKKSRAQNAQHPNNPCFVSFFRGDYKIFRKKKNRQAYSFWWSAAVRGDLCLGEFVMLAGLDFGSVNTSCRYMYILHNTSSDYQVGVAADLTPQLIVPWRVSKLHAETWAISG